MQPFTIAFWLEVRRSKQPMPIFEKIDSATTDAADGKCGSMSRF